METVSLPFTVYGKVIIIYTICIYVIRHFSQGIFVCILRMLFGANNDYFPPQHYLICLGNEMVLFCVRLKVNC